MNRMFYFIILIHAVFIMGCSDNIVYNNVANNNRQQSKAITNNASTKSMGEVEAIIYVGINKIRSGKHLATLKRDPKLDTVARDYSEAMARVGSISHVDPNGKSMEDRLEKNGLVDWSQAGENLASSTVGAEPAQSALWGWQQSPGHLENIMLPSYVYTGIGAYKDPRSGEVFITQLFMTP